MRISDWSSDVCSSDLPQILLHRSSSLSFGGFQLSLSPSGERIRRLASLLASRSWRGACPLGSGDPSPSSAEGGTATTSRQAAGGPFSSLNAASRSEEHTSELQSLMRISYAVFCLKKKQTNKQ